MDLTLLSGDVVCRQIDAAHLVDLIQALGEMTATPSLWPRIPALMARALDLEAVTLALIEQADQGQDLRIVSLAATAGESVPLKEGLLRLQRQWDNPAEDQTLDLTDESAQRRGAIVKAVDRTHRLVLVFRSRSEAASGRDGLIPVLHLVTTQMARMHRLALQWQQEPGVLGTPFDRLTAKEWVVLLGLNGEDGEKQIADHLSLSPHTLHSHIKSIYRKMGCQGRLPLLQKLRSAVQEFRLRELTRPLVPDRENAPRLAS